MSVLRCQGVPRTRFEPLIKELTGITLGPLLRLAPKYNITPANSLYLLTDYDIALAIKDIGISGTELHAPAS